MGLLCRQIHSELVRVVCEQDGEVITVRVVRPDDEIDSVLFCDTMSDLVIGLPEVGKSRARV